MTRPLSAELTSTLSYQNSIVNKTKDSQLQETTSKLQVAQDALAFEHEAFVKVCGFLGFLIPSFRYPLAH